MKVVLLALSFATAVTALGAPAQAQEKWCAQIYGEGGRENCHFRSFRQCQDSVSGRGGFCRPSQYYLGGREGRGSYAAEPSRRSRSKTR
jgi:hypothetical protein